MYWLKYIKTLRLLLASFVGCGFLLTFTTLRAQNTSRLVSGAWMKLGVTKTGIYKVDRDFIRKIGWDPTSIDPRTVKIYGLGGAMLPQANSLARPAEPLEGAAWFDGQADGQWDASDALYFYAEGPHTIFYDSDTKRLAHQLHSYSDTNYYFITYGGQVGRRIESSALPPWAGQPLLTSFVDYWFHETERYNLLQSGRRWWGEYLGGSPLAVSVPMSDLLPGSEVSVRFSAIASAQVTTGFTLTLNGATIGTGNFGTVPGQTYTQKGAIAEGSYVSTLSGAPADIQNITVAYHNNGQLSAQAFLDYLTLQGLRSFKAYDQQQIYHFLPASSDTTSYHIDGLSGSGQLWDVTVPLSPGLLLKGTTANFSLKNSRRYRRFIGFDPQQALVPTSYSPVDQPTVEVYAQVALLIITAPAFVEQAQRLADFRHSQDGLPSAVVTTDQIYNHHASGKADPVAIRDYIRNVYQNSKLKYVLLFGDATYDYKNNLKNQTPSQWAAWVPTYQSRESLLPVYTYASDDFFGFMDEDEGAWEESVAGDELLDIGVGRLPVKSLEEADQMVEKLMHYQSPGSMGAWHNTVRFVADDGDGNIHQYHASELAKLIDHTFLTKKIFLDEQPQKAVEGGQRSPATNGLIRDGIERGSLIMNYTGHGGGSGWAEEQILTLSDMIGMRGYDNLPILVTATCDFGRFDNMAQVSGGELMVLSPKGGAIAALSTTRPVYSSTNFTLNKALYRALSQSDTLLRLGDLVRETKNNSLVGSLNRNFTLIGDPSMPVVDQSRTIKWSAVPDTLRPQQRVKLQGQIQLTRTGELDGDFDGVAYLSIYDQPSSFATLGDQDGPEKYTDNRNKLYEGSLSVQGGAFELEFIVPVSTDTAFRIGRASVYSRSGTGTHTASAQLPLVIGGKATATSSAATQISAFLNDESFRDGDLVEPSSLLMVRLQDELGIQLSQPGIILNLNDTLEIGLEDYYRADLDDYTRGTVVYPLQDLPIGHYTATVKVYNSYNNLSKITFGFVVGAQQGIQVSDLVVYPMPFRDQWSFDLKHNRADEDVALELSVLTLSGALIGTEKWILYNAPKDIRKRVTDIALTTKLQPNEMYLYRLIVKSLADRSVSKRMGRLMRAP
ncbi:peptidase C25-like protein [Dyadobacter jejuensis]|uniref:Peptidase C25-like protein n=1 Tax=Dyadobacter jejuensis TaxID=1082580 RepID=A0A316ART8_9BACT|nr:type IX secretion system sortase PorU [Dyadobacter jejuensis]PWJ60228.1 peptidase C25-like protein [Dyadobacter jejuensis]